MPEITTEYDAKVNVVVAKEALAKGKREGADAKAIKKLQKNVKDAEGILSQIQKALKASKKK